MNKFFITLILLTVAHVVAAQPDYTDYKMVGPYEVVARVELPCDMKENYHFGET